MLRCWRMVANQPIRCTTSSGLQARAARAVRTARAERDLGTAHLFGGAGLEQGFDRPRPLGTRGHEHPELVVREPWVVGDGPLMPGGERSEERRVGKECRCGWGACDGNGV